MKFAALVLFAMAGCVATLKFPDVPDYIYDSDTEEEFSALALIPADDVETGSLKAEHQVFADYCIQSRDEIKAFLQSSTNGAAASVFNALFSNVGELGNDLISAQKEAIEQGTELIRENAVAPMPQEVADDKEEVKKDLEQSVENVSLLSVVKSAVKVVIQAVIETAQTQLFQRLALLRARFNGETLKEMVNDACQSIQFDLQKKLDSKLAATKREISVSAGKSNTAVQEMLAKVRPENVGCVSTSRVSKIARFCDIFRMSGPTIFPLLGM